MPICIIKNANTGNNGIVNPVSRSIMDRSHLSDVTRRWSLTPLGYYGSDMG
jgi:hypothetical protein